MYETYFPTEMVTKVKPNINSVEVHPQESNNGHPVDGALVGIGTSVFFFLIFKFKNIFYLFIYLFIFYNLILGVKFCHFFDKEIADILDFFFCLSSVISTNFFLHF
jgi:hypothetical protein